MRFRRFARAAAGGCLAVVFWAGVADAGFFRRYPEAGEEDQAASPPAQSAPAPAPAQAPLPEDAVPRRDSTGEGFDELNAEEPVESGGLLGQRFHGRGGLAVEYIYTGEVFANMRGGLDTRRAAAYRGNFDLVMIGDLDEMGFAPGGTIFLYGQNGHGCGLTDTYVGDFQTISNIDAPDFMQMSEFWWSAPSSTDWSRSAWASRTPTPSSTWSNWPATTSTRPSASRPPFPCPPFPTRAWARPPSST